METEIEIDDDDKYADKIKYEFKLDNKMKKLIKSLDNDLLIEVLNYISKEEFNKDSTVYFESTEGFDATGDPDTEVRIGDNLIKIVTEDEINRVALEVQSKKYHDKHLTMGFRLYLYCTNAMTREKIDGEYVYNAPIGITIYTDLSLPFRGVDKFIVNYPKYWAGNTQYFGKDKDFFKIEYQYINLLGLDFNKFDGTPLEVFQILYLYRYRKKIKLLELKTFKEEMEILANKISKYEGKTAEILMSMYQELMLDIIELAGQQEYEEEKEVMQTIEKSYGELFREKWIAVGRAEAEDKIAKAEDKIAKAEAKAEAKIKAEKAKAEAEKAKAEAIIKAEKAKAEAEKAKAEDKIAKLEAEKAEFEAKLRAEYEAKYNKGDTN